MSWSYCTCISEYRSVLSRSTVLLYHNARRQWSKQCPIVMAMRRPKRIDPTTYRVEPNQHAGVRLQPISVDHTRSPRCLTAASLTAASLTAASVRKMRNRNAAPPSARDIELFCSPRARNPAHGRRHQVCRPVVPEVSLTLHSQHNNSTHEHEGEGLRRRRQYRSEQLVAAVPRRGRFNRGAYSPSPPASPSMRPLAPHPVSEYVESLDQLKQPSEVVEEPSGLGLEDIVAMSADQLDKRAPDAPVSDRRFKVPELIQERFSVGIKLGQGSFGMVYSGVNKETGEEVAIKVIRTSHTDNPGERRLALNEAALMQRAQNPYIVKVFLAEEFKDNVVIVMERCDAGSLEDYVQGNNSLTDFACRSLITQVLRAVDYLHSELQVVHRDLKPENILLKNVNGMVSIKLGDFGLATQMESTRVMKLVAGTPAYIAPEVVGGGGYSRAVDCWSVGVMTFYMLTGSLPFDKVTPFDVEFNGGHDSSSNPKHEVKPAKNGGKMPRRPSAELASEQKCPHIDFPPHISSAAKDLIQKLLKVNPLVRITTKEALSHYWITGESQSEEEKRPTLMEMLSAYRNDDDQE